MTEAEAHLPMPYKHNARPGRVVPITLGSATVGDGEVAKVNDDGSIVVKMHITDELVADLIKTTAPTDISIRPVWPSGSIEIAPNPAKPADD